jgi:hypothetical protein
MIKALEQAIEKVKALSEERQAYPAEVLEEIAAAGDEVNRLSDQERRLVHEGLAELDGGEVASEAEVRAVLDKSFMRRERYATWMRSWLTSISTFRAAPTTCRWRSRRGTACAR